LELQAANLRWDNSFHPEGVGREIALLQTASRTISLSTGSHYSPNSSNKLPKIGSFAGLLFPAASGEGLFVYPVRLIMTSRNHERRIIHPYKNANDTALPSA
jgi:hypothetical protein